MSPKISVIMSVYNSEEYLEKAIKSILEQTYDDFEFIIINDGSKDGSLKIIKSFDDQRIRLVDRANKGLTYSLNEGLKLAKGDYIARQDSDDISVPTRFEKEVALLDADPKLALVGSNYTIIDEEDTPLVTTQVFEHPDDLKLALIASNQYGHGSIMMRRSVVEKIGNYDSSVGAVEDYDLWCRIAREGKVTNIHEPLYLWRRNPVGVTMSNQDTQVPQAFAIRDREFDYMLKHRSQYHFFGWHPFGEGYRAKKALLYRDLAYLYRRRGHIIMAVVMQLACIALSPRNKRHYAYLVWLFNRKWFDKRFGYEFL